MPREGLNMDIKNEMCYSGKDAVALSVRGSVWISVTNSVANSVQLSVRNSVHDEILEYNYDDY